MAAAVVDLIGALPTGTPDALLSARQAAGLSQAQAAELAGLSGAIRWSEYERGVRSIDPARWAVFLLATGQHPSATARPAKNRL